MSVANGIAALSSPFWGGVGGGGGHGLSAQAAYDAQRTSALEARGFRVLRFTNAEVTQSIDALLDKIFAALAAAFRGEGSRRGIARPDAVFEGGAKPRSRSGEATTPTPDPSPQGRGE